MQAGNRWPHDGAPGKVGRVRPPPVDVPMVRRLVGEQFPHWAELPVMQVEPGGWDNRPFRLGTDMLVRLPSAEGYVAAVAEE